MDKKTIAVIFGGCSTEYEVSLQSACSVLANLDAEKYEAVKIGITRQGDWYRYNGGLAQGWGESDSCGGVPEPDPARPAGTASRGDQKDSAGSGISCAARKKRGGRHGTGAV